MPRVKIIYGQRVEDEWKTNFILQDGLEWEEVSEEDARALCRYSHKIPEYLGLRAFVIVESTPSSSKPVIKLIAATLRKDEAANKKRQAELEEKRKIREEQNKAKRLEKKKKMLEKLKAELES
jgi:hypothetical protein